MSFLLASQILRGRWFMDPDAALQYGPLLQQLFEGKPLSGSDYFSKQVTPQLINNVGHAFALDNPEADNPIPHEPDQQGLVMVIPIVGAIMKYDTDCGPVGSATLAKYLNRAANDPKISGVVLKADSPGGMVDGTKTFADAVADFPKPIVGFIDDGTCASAAYYMICGCDEIVASQKTDIIGSIGVMISFADTQPYFEKMGVKFYEVYADQSKDKNKIFRELLAGNEKPVKEEMLNPLAQEFIDFVKAARGKALNAKQKGVLSGATFLAENCIDNGLIDTIGSFDYAVSRVREMGNRTGSTKKTSMGLFSSNEKIKELEDQVTELTQEGEIMENQLIQASKEADQLKEASAKLEADAEKLRADLAAATEKISAIESDRDEWKQKAEEYGSQPGAVHTAVKSDGDREVKKEEYLTETDAEARRIQGVK